MVASTQRPSLRAAEIIDRFFFVDNRRMTSELAEHILSLEVPADDLARMSDLLARNQLGELTPAEIEEMHAYSDAGCMLAIFQSRARRILKKAPPKPRRKRGHE